MAKKVQGKYIDPNSIGFNHVSDELKGSATNNTGAWNLAAAGDLICALSANTNIVMSGFERNKITKVLLTLSSGGRPIWDDTKTQRIGDAIDADGTYMLWLDCWDATPGSEKVVVSILKSTFS